MAAQTSRLYEAMFLVEPNVATDWDATKGMIQKLMDRAHAEVLACRLWDERKLAYDIEKQKRAAYVLCHFRADGANIAGMERDVQLSEHLLRVLILRADHITPEEVERIQSLPERREPPPEPEPSRWRRDSRSRRDESPRPAPADSPRVDEEPVPAEEPSSESHESPPQPQAIEPEKNPDESVPQPDPASDGQPDEDAAQR